MPERTDHNEAMRLAQALKNRQEVEDDAADMLIQQAERIAELERDYGQACRLVANLHTAATGSMQGPKRGVVEDVADVATERDQLRAEVERLRREKANAIDKAGHMLAAGMGLSNCAFNLKQRVGEPLSIRDVAALESSQRAWDAVLDAARTTHKDTE